MDDNAFKTLLHEFPFYNPIIEDELHVLVTCPKYNLPRAKLPNEVLNILLRHDTHDLFRNKQHLFHIAQYVKNIFELRNSKKANWIVFIFSRYLFIFTSR